jgi:FtsP/CotA-like multicopper oxidase with cupredoxin domain
MTREPANGTRTEETRMDARAHGATRREFLRAGGLGVAGAMAAGGLFAGVRAASAANVQRAMGLVGTDGHVILPGRPGGKPLYIFGFAAVPPTATVSQVSSQYKGKAQLCAPVLVFDQDTDVTVTVTNAGLAGRPDLTDAHTLHWHGFRTPTALMDGVPEVSIGVPIGRQFPYFFRPHDPGTYMYHCHFEDVEHVQMGMTGIVFVRPSGQRWRAYADASTAFDREFAILLNELWTSLHDNDENIQETIFTDYDPDYWTLNGRVYPQTTYPNDDTRLPSQPVSSLIQCRPGDRVLLRLANLGYQQHALQIPGVAMRVIGQDASPLSSPFTTHTVFMGPGEARDVLVTAPAFTGARPVATDAQLGPFNTYLLRNADASRLTNAGARGLGGMATEMRVYQGALPAQAEPNQTHA